MPLLTVAYTNTDPSIEDDAPQAASDSDDQEEGAECIHHSGVLPDSKSASLARAVGKILATAAARSGTDLVLAVRRRAFSLVHTFTEVVYRAASHLSSALQRRMQRMQTRGSPSACARSSRPGGAGCVDACDGRLKKTT